MPRKTIYLPDGAKRLVHEHARDGESFSATVLRLIELGAAEDVEFGPVDAGSSPWATSAQARAAPPTSRSTRRNISA